MTITNFIPQVWSARLTHNLERQSVYLPNSNRQYEGDAQVGNVVKVFSLDPDQVTVKDYSRTANLAAAETLTTTTQDLRIDQEKYFNFQVEDLDQLQARGNVLDTATSNAVRKVSESIDTFVGSQLFNVANRDIGGRDGTKTAGVAFAINFINKYKLFAMGLNLPLTSVICVATPAIIAKLDAMILSGDLSNIAQASALTGIAPDAAQTGSYGRIAGINFYISNQDYMKDETSGKETDAAVFYDPRDLAAVVQVNKVEAYRPQARFSDAVKGLTAYGSKVLNPSRVYTAHFLRSSLAI